MRAEVRTLAGIGDGQQPAHAARALHRPAQIQAPQVRLADGRCRIEAGEQVPAVIHVSHVVGGVAAPGRVVPHPLPDAPPLVVVVELQRNLRPHASRGRQLHQPVLRVPGVRPPAVAGQVAIGVIDEGFRILRQQQTACAVRHNVRPEVIAQRGHARDGEPQRPRVVVEQHFPAEIIPLARRRRVERKIVLAPQAHRRGIRYCTQYVHKARHGAAGVLVQQLHA
ncbi:MAG: hypothetical protein BWX48_00094 [Verrucomicrobia bacterium ADurb.Bin006]|nr:MAG: hypothetical protein BWX48_00094 [Verrucomicrobia bacterium ADurb.Bin006]